MVCIRIYLQSVLRYKFLILDVYHLVTPYVHDVGICKNERCLRAKKSGKHCSEGFNFDEFNLQKHKLFQ